MATATKGLQGLLDAGKIEILQIRLDDNEYAALQGLLDAGKIETSGTCTPMQVSALLQGLLDAGKIETSNLELRSVEPLRCKGCSTPERSRH